MFKKVFGNPEPPSDERGEFIWQNLPEGNLGPSELRDDMRLADSLLDECSMGCDRIALSRDDQRLVLATRQKLSLTESRNMEETLRRGSFGMKYGLFLMPSFPVVVLKTYIFDNPGNPFWLETFLSVENKVQRRVIEYLAAPDHLYRMGFHFYDGQGTLIFRVGYGGITGERRAVNAIADMLNKADFTLESLPRRKWDFALAVEQVLEDNERGIPASALTTLFDA